MHSQSRLKSKLPSERVEAKSACIRVKLVYKWVELVYERVIWVVARLVWVHVRIESKVIYWVVWVESKLAIDEWTSKSIKHSSILLRSSILTVNDVDATKLFDATIETDTHTPAPPAGYN